ncbi:MAG: pyridoxamine 5'-phosphate oxidase family protein [Rhizobiales bacterium]|nr:pyridoxamine 5'-phosphate oxidase family protein [Hyphomicrobiales bacterium]
MAKLTEAVRADIDASVLCWLATVGADGTPNVSPKEIFCAEGEAALLIADIASPVSVANIRANPSVCVSFVDVFRQLGWKIVGEARVIARDDPEAMRVGAALIGMAEPDYPVRHVIRVTPTKIARIRAPSYVLHPEMDEAERLARTYRAYGVRPAAR